MAQTETDSGKTANERIVAIAKAIAILVTAAVAVYGAFVKGEPGAELSYKELARGFNDLRAEFAKQQSFVDGFLSGLKQVPAPVAVAAPKCIEKPKVFAPASHPVTKAPPAPIQQQLPSAMPPTLDGLKSKSAP